VIVGTQRTGSSALAESVGMHPAVACGWEWSLRVPWLKKISAAEKALNGDFSALMDHERQHMAGLFSDRIEWLGYRSLFSSSDKWLIAPRFSAALLFDRFGEHLRWFRGQRDLHIIHIVRHDNLEWLKSKFVAVATNAYVGTEYPEDLKVDIPLRASVKRLQSKAWVDTMLSTLADTNPYLVVRYEDLLRDRVATVSSALRFLRLDPSHVDLSQAKIARQSTGDASRYISNYDLLQKTLKENGLLTSHL
jgi:hypothetical protein